ncbi:MAG: phosphoribosylformylglycinamidine synthase II [Chloroflexi bacterium]|nr:phosphoribosylformylglycinamidine synthase II [Chloroflexota bacterium]|tara:strand:+ start:806 stop:2998 length:2193 start_codon:yes stop_codon:yes gene_type:complete
MAYDKEILDELAISDSEYDLIVERLGREPNYLELGLFGSLWSEHCGYKHSKPLLKLFASDNPRLLVSAGEENAGVVDIGDGFAIVFKIESHNHPSAIEPYQGAATGVGGIVRDIFAMGARPVALLNSLRFGPIEEERNKYLFDGVVSGISGYGNCIGVPNIGGEVFFSRSYAGNPLVNAMCLGLLKAEELIKATSGSVGNLLILAGSGTGKDGIHGASGLASRSFEDERELRPTVQVGNPFLEKILIEACLEVARTGKIDGMQDLGAAGLTSASVECAASGGSGIAIDIDTIPRRDEDMTPYEVMLSETQERMLVSVKPENLEFVTQIFDRWDIENTVIGKVTDSKKAQIIGDGELLADLPVELLTDPPQYVIDSVASPRLKELQNYDLNSIGLPGISPNLAFLKLLSSCNIACKESVYQRYDHQVQTNTVISPGSDGALIRIKGTNKGIAASTDGNGRLAFLDPYVGGQIAVAEACRNISCTGCEPIALTNCLNFGNPEKPEVYFQLESCVKGMADASRAFSSPVISGNVSLYNETQGSPIFPTPVVGAVGLTEDVGRHVDISFKGDGDAVLLLGASEVTDNVKYFSGSEYLEVFHDLVAGQPSIELDKEVAVQALCRNLIKHNLVKSAHDCSEGGLAIALAESCIKGGIGFIGEFELGNRWDAQLFGEQQSRIVISVQQDNIKKVLDLCLASGVEVLNLGITGGEKFWVAGLLDLSLDEISKAWLAGP